jgi:hypothetical protein
MIHSDMPGEHRREHQRHARHREEDVVHQIAPHVPLADRYGEERVRRSRSDRAHDANRHLNGHQPA